MCDINLLECLFIRKIRIENKLIVVSIKYYSFIIIHKMFYHIVSIILSNSHKFILFNSSILRYFLLFYIRKKYRNFTVN